MARFRVHTGLNYPGADGEEKRAEPGAIVDDLPARSLPWLLEQGHITPADETSPVAPVQTSASDDAPERG